MGADFFVTGGQTDAGGTLTRMAATNGARLRIRRRPHAAPALVFDAEGPPTTRTGPAAPGNDLSSLYDGSLMHLRMRRISLLCAQRRLKRQAPQGKTLSTAIDCRTQRCRRSNASKDAPDNKALLKPTASIGVTLWGDWLNGTGVHKVPASVWLESTAFLHLSKLPPCSPRLARLCVGWLKIAADRGSCAPRMSGVNGS